MKINKLLLVLIFLLGLSSQVQATNYYVSNSGNDQNDGLTTNTPWKSIGRTNNQVFVGGDSILFKRGDVWRENLVPSSSGFVNNYIKYSAYGAGDKPLILGSDAYNLTSEWRSDPDNPNIWFAENTPLPTLLIMFGDENPANIGEPKATKEEVVNSRDYWHDPDTDRIYTYANGNPASIFGSIEIPVRRFLTIVSDKSYVIIENIHFKYPSSRAIHLEKHAKEIIVRKNTITYSGGNWQITNINPLRGRGGGNSINVSDDVSNVSVEENMIDQCYDYAIGVHNYDPNNPDNEIPNMTIENIVIKNNIISNCSGGISVTSMSTKPTTVIKNIKVFGNTITHSGYGWSGYGRLNGLPEEPLRDRGLGAHGVGITTTAQTGSTLTNNEFHHNTITHFASAGIQQDRLVTNIDIHHNTISKGTGDYTGLYSTAGIKITNGASVNVHHNIIYNMNIRGVSFTNQIHGQPTSNFYNNTLYNVGVNNSIPSFDVLNSSNANIYNNIIYTNDKTPLRVQSTTDIALNNNIYYRDNGAVLVKNDGTDYIDMPTWLATNRDTDSISADPLFTSALRGDFQPLPTSPALSNGVIIGALGSVAIRADVDKQNGIDINDASLVLRNSIGLSMTSTNWKDTLTTGNVNCDGTSNSVDAMLILMYVQGLSMSETDWCVNEL